MITTVFAIRGHDLWPFVPLLLSTGPGMYTCRNMHGLVGYNIFFSQLRKRCKFQHRSTRCSRYMSAGVVCLHKHLVVLLMRMVSK